MARKEEYKQQNIDFLKEISQKEGVQRHPSGIMYEVVQQGSCTQSPNFMRLFSREVVHNRLI
ncbi:peptidyl-prolyl cis-trans isomerase [Bacteroides sp. CAG:443]|nr:peptidyl-prolyl cis-trans isomerase [Bacteroides sp. CAG:443]